MALEFKSAKLEAVLQRVATAPRSIQERVAEVVDGILGSFMCSDGFLQDLPLDVSRVIVRIGGPATRRASRLLNDIYGPLDCNITLDGILTHQQLAALLAPSPSRFHHVPSLCLTAASSDEYGVPHTTTLLGASLVRALPSAFPSLKSLTFSQLTKAAGADLSHLAPLSSRLTSLTLPLGTDNTLFAAARSLQPFTALVALSIGLDEVHDMPQAMAALARLPRLRSLELLRWKQDRMHDKTCFSDTCVCCAASWFTSVSSLLLTHLALGMYLHSWDKAAINTLATALPQLQSLHLSPDFTCKDRAQSVNADSEQQVLQALASRTALTLLQLSVDQLADGADLGFLSRLELLRALHVVHNENDDGVVPEKVERVLQAMAVRCTLTKLDLESVSLEAGWLELSEEGWASLTALSSSLEVLELEDTVLGKDKLIGWSRLQVLHLSSSCSLYPDTILPVLPNLRMLTLANVCCKAEIRTLLAHASSLTALCNLEISGDLTAGFNDRQDVDLRQLSCLHRTLTRLSVGRLYDSSTRRSVTGLALAMVRHLTCLQQLVIGRFEAEVHEQLHEYILPLPGSLRRLHLEGWPAGYTVHPLLLEAAATQDCGVRVGVWV